MKMDTLSTKQGTDITPEKLLTLIKQKENLKIGSGLLVGEIKPEEVQPVIEKTKNENSKLEAVRGKILEQMEWVQKELKTETKEENIESVEVKKLAQDKLSIIKEIRDTKTEIEELEKNTIEPVKQIPEEKEIKIEDTKTEEIKPEEVKNIKIEEKKEEKIVGTVEVEEKLEKTYMFLKGEYAFSDEEIEKLTTDNQRILKKNSKLFKDYPGFKKLVLAGAILLGGTLIYSKKDKNGNTTYQNIKNTTTEKTIPAQQKNVGNFTTNEKHKKQNIVTTEENRNINQIESEKPIELNANQNENGSNNTIESEKPSELNAPSYGYSISGQREVTNKTQIIESEKPTELRRTKQNKVPETTKTTSNKENKKEIKEEPKKEVIKEKVEKEDLTKKLYYDIHPRTLKKVNEIYESNLISLFPDNKKTLAWDNIKDSRELTAEFMMNKKEGSSNGIYNPYISYLHKLHFKTGLNPKTGETNEEYVRRALQKLAKMEKLNDIAI